jgi:hypothetical protein
LFRALGWLLLAMAVAVVVHDGLAWWSEGSFRLFGLGELWSKLDIGSLKQAEGMVQGLSGSLWSSVVGPVLTVPAVLAFLGLGVVFLWIGGRAGAPEAPTYIGAGRQKRRRSRGGLS